MKKLSIILFVMLATPCLACTCTNSNLTDVFCFPSSDGYSLKGKIWYPSSPSSDVLAIYTGNCNNLEFSPDSQYNKRFSLVLRDSLLKSGIFYCELLGRSDSISVGEERFPSSTFLTKANDVDEAISYLKTTVRFKNKQFILIGQSEGGTTSLHVAENNPEIKALVLLSTPALSGFETLAYQSKCRDTIFMTTFGTNPEVFKTLNQISSLKNTEYEPNFEGYLKFKQDMFDPLAQIVFQFNGYDTIASRIIDLLQQKWDMEDNETKTLHKNFKNYCNAHQYLSFIRPDNISRLKARPEFYLSSIKCPVLAVFGTNDRNVEYQSSINAIRDLLFKRGNEKFTVLTLSGHDHFLLPPRQEPLTAHDECISTIIDWINDEIEVK